MPCCRLVAPPEPDAPSMGIMVRLHRKAQRPNVRRCGIDAAWETTGSIRGSDSAKGRWRYKHARLKTRTIMWATDQVRGAHAAFGRGRYSLWTGDAGLAVYLWHCISGEPQFPTVGMLL